MEAAPVRDGVADDEALPRPHVLVPHGSELRLEGSKGQRAPRPRERHADGHSFQAKEETDPLPAVLSQGA